VYDFSGLVSVDTGVVTEIPLTRFYGAISIGGFIGELNTQAIHFGIESGSAAGCCYRQPDIAAMTGY
jgi:hypothetical protein